MRSFRNNRRSCSFHNGKNKAGSQRACLIFFAAGRACSRRPRKKDFAPKGRRCALEHSTEILYNGTSVYCTAEHHFGSDALLLARFARPWPSQRAADLCSGCGIVALEWHDGGHRGPCAAVEQAPEASALLDAALAGQHIGHIAPVCADLRTWRPVEAGRFDLVACNPPYFTAGAKSPAAARAAARHESEESCTLAEVCAEAALLLRDGGRFALCHRPERLADVFAALRAARLEPKRLAFVKHDAAAAPWLLLAEGRKNRRPGLVVEPDILTGGSSAATRY